MITTNKAAFTRINISIYFIDCPCHANCLDGCPCPSYDCNAINSLLVINSASSKNAIRFEWGNDFEALHSNIDFRYEDDTQSYYSCSYMFNNDMYIVGGLNFKRQVAVVSDCGLSQTEIFLPMEFDNGRCTTLSSEQVFMCFPYDAGSNCWSFDGNKFMQEANSLYPHYLGGISEWNNSIIAIAGQQSVSTEIWSVDSAKWTELESLPEINYLMYLSAVLFHEQVFVFGM